MYRENITKSKERTDKTQGANIPISFTWSPAYHRGLGHQGALSWLAPVTGIARDLSNPDPPRTRPSDQSTAKSEIGPTHGQGPTTRDNPFLE